MLTLVLATAAEIHEADLIRLVDAKTKVDTFRGVPYSDANDQQRLEGFTLSRVYLEAMCREISAQNCLFLCHELRFFERFNAALLCFVVTSFA